MCKSESLSYESREQPVDSSKSYRKPFKYASLSFPIICALALKFVGLRPAKDTIMALKVINGHNSRTDWARAGVSKLRPARPFHPAREAIFLMMKNIMLKKNCEICLRKSC